MTDKKPPLTKKEVNEVKDMATFMSVKSIAKQLDRYESTIYRALARKADWEPYEQKYTPEDKADMIKRFKTGETKTAICNRYKATHAELSYILDKHRKLSPQVGKIRVNAHLKKPPVNESRKSYINLEARYSGIPDCFV